MVAELTNKQKVAILLVYLGVDISSRILKYLEEEQIEEICREISRLGQVKPETVDEVIREFHQLMLSGISAKGGMSFLKEVLEKSLGASRALAIINRLTEVQPFSYLKDVSAARLAGILSQEHPQTIAIVLSYMPPAGAAAVLSQLPERLKFDVALRIATGIKDVQIEAINDVDKALKAAIVSQQYQTWEAVSGTEESGTKILAEILNKSETKTEKEILEKLQKINAGLAEQVREQMFVFEDIISLDDRSLQKVIRQIDSKDLSLALKLADEPLKEKIFKNMSERAREILKEEIEYLGPVRIRQAEEAQQKILEIIRQLEQTGEIILPKRGVEERFV